MRYIAHRRFKDTAICGAVNIPALTECIADNGTIYFNGSPLCFVSSENAHQFFARNDDERGISRGKLTQAIQKRLSKRDAGYQARWDLIWDDKLCQLYRRKEYDDFWLWNHDFFEADIEALRYIAKLIGAKEEG